MEEEKKEEEEKEKRKEKREEEEKAAEQKEEEKKEEVNEETDDEQVAFFRYDGVYTSYGHSALACHGTKVTNTRRKGRKRKWMSRRRCRRSQEERLSGVGIRWLR